jgi:hypothetical protein
MLFWASDIRREAISSLPVPVCTQSNEGYSTCNCPAAWDSAASQLAQYWRFVTDTVVDFQCVSIAQVQAVERDHERPS